MTTDEVKAFLRSYRSIQREVERLNEEKAYWRSLAEKVTPSGSGSGGTGGIGDNIPKCIEKIDELNRKFDTKIQELVEKRSCIESIISELEPKGIKEIFRYRYINGYKWERIAEKMNYSIRRVHQLHGSGILMIKGLH